MFKFGFYPPAEATEEQQQQQQRPPSPPTAADAAATDDARLDAAATADQNAASRVIGETGWVGGENEGSVRVGVKSLSNKLEVIVCVKLTCPMNCLVLRIVHAVYTIMPCTPVRPTSGGALFDFKPTRPLGKSACTSWARRRQQSRLFLRKRMRAESRMPPMKMPVMNYCFTASIERRTS